MASSVAPFSQACDAQLYGDTCTESFFTEGMLRFDGSTSHGSTSPDGICGVGTATGAGCKNDALCAFPLCPMRPDPGCPCRRSVQRPDDLLERVRQGIPAVLLCLRGADCGGPAFERLPGLPGRLPGRRRRQGRRALEGPTHHRVCRGAAARWQCTLVQNHSGSVPTVLRLASCCSAAEDFLTADFLLYSSMQLYR